MGAGDRHSFCVEIGLVKAHTSFVLRYSIRCVNDTAVLTYSRARMILIQSLKFFNRDGRFLPGFIGVFRRAYR